MPWMCRVALLAALCLVPLVGATAQRPTAPDLAVSDDTTVVDEISLRDGTLLVGRIVRVDGEVVTVRTHGGLEIAVRRSDVVAVRRLRGAVRYGRVWEADASDSRLFLGPTARVPPNGSGYVGVYELVFLSGAVGVGGLGMISGGVSLVPGIDITEQVFYVAPKVQLVNLPTVQAAAGLFWVKPGSSDESAGLVFGNVTGGTRDAALTVAAALPFASDAGFADEPLVMLGGELRVDRSLKLITENWFVPGDDLTLVSFGARIITRTITVEAGVVTSTDADGFLPIVSFSVVW